MNAESTTGQINAEPQGMPRGDVRLELRAEALPDTAVDAGSSSPNAGSQRHFATAFRPLAALLLCLLGLLSAAQGATTNSLTALLQQGLLEEQANRDLDAAIANYQALARQFDQNRQLAATAIFRLGECYRAQGKTNEAAAQYQRILSEFVDQTSLTTLSRQDLAGMGMPTESGAASARQQQKDLLTKQVALAEQDLADTQDMVQMGKATPVEIRAAEREVLRLKQQLVALDAGKTEPSDLSAKAPGEEDQEIARIQKTVQNSPDLINAPDSRGFTPLSNAAGHDWLRAVNYLLDSGASMDSQALIIAAEAGHKAMVELLLQRGAEVNVCDNQGNTALHHAAGKGFVSVAEVLIQHGANLEAHNNATLTPLLCAASQKNSAMAELLTTKGADVNACDQDGMTALARAASSGAADILDQLLHAGAKPDAENRLGMTALGYAVNAGDPESVRTLLAAKANPNAGKNGSTLFAAVRPSRMEILKLLLAAGINPNVRDETKKTPLMLAVEKNAYEIANLLIQHGAEVEATVNGESPLQRATWAGSTKIVTLLLEHGANPDLTFTAGVRGTEKTTLLMSAASSAVSGEPEIIDQLLKHKADPNLKNAAGDTALIYAVQKGNLPAVRALLAGGANPNLTGPDGLPPLIMAIGNYSNRDVAKALIEAKADVNGVDREGYTPLDAAAARKNLAMVELLVKAGAEVNRRNNQGATPLDYAKRDFNSDETKRIAGTAIADYLRQHGARDDLPNWDRITVSRPAANFSEPVYYRGTNDWNHFTLLEAILNFYGSSRTHVISQGNGMQILNSGSDALPFPDLTRDAIVRPSHGTTNQTRTVVNLLNPANEIDSAQDVPLEFGDVVEISERDHALGDKPVGLTDDQRAALFHLLEARVHLIVRGQTAVISIYPCFDSSISSMLKRTEAQNLLLSSSDLSQVKVTRTNPKTGKNREWTLDCRPAPAPATGIVVFGSPGMNQPQPPFSELWLRDGDVIEVPEKM